MTAFHPALRAKSSGFPCRAILALLSAAISQAADKIPMAKGLGDLSLEELMNESVTSVSKKETRLGESPAAIAVVTSEDIQRTGHTTLPELLRLVPGMDVARIHGNEWALTARGFNDQYANKLLVLMDGRTVYSPMFAGVYWNAQDVVLEDLDRIEVIRGPGATLWGVNAVNGVINITTKSAKETQGGLVTTSVGTEERTSTTVRYGGTLSPTLYYRVYAKYFDRDGFVERSDQNGVDSWSLLRTGTRLDWEPHANDSLTFQADYYRGSVGEHFDATVFAPPFVAPLNLIHHNFGGNVLARWKHQFSTASDVTTQAYFDRFYHGDGDITETRNTSDLDVQHHLALGDRNDVVWGLGYRDTKDRLAPTFYLTFTPERAHERFYGVFAQDEIVLQPRRWKMTIGSKFEHNDATGWEVQPNLRLLWTPTPQQSTWASVSRAVRTPSRYDRNARLNTAAFQPPGSPPFLVSLLSHPDAGIEKLTAYEAGYRIETTQRWSIDLAGFYQEYRGILGYEAGPVVFENEPAPPHLLLPLHFRNVNAGETYGSEISLQWRATSRWKLIGSYSWLHMHLRPLEGQEQENPRHQFQLRSYLDLPRHVQFNAAAYFVDRLTVSLDEARVPIDRYLRLDLGVSWRPIESFEVGVWGQNLLDRRHPEYGSFKTTTLTEVPRNVVAKFTWHF